MEENKNMIENTEKTKSTRKVVFGTIAVVIAVAVAVIILLLRGCNPVAKQSELEKWLASSESGTFELNEDVTLSGLAYVNGDKVITGSGTIKVASDSEYAFVINDDASLSLNGPTLDGDNTGANGIYVSEKASFKLMAGGIKNFLGHGVRVLGDAEFTGGAISDVGTNWIIADTGAVVDISGGTFRNAGSEGVLTAEGSECHISGNTVMDGAKSNIIYNCGNMTVEGGTYSNSGAYSIHNEGSIEISGVDFAGAAILGYVENQGEMYISGGSMKGSKADFIYNQGKAEVKNVEFDNCSSTAIENRGMEAELNIQNCTFDNIGKAAILNKNGSVDAENINVGTCGSYAVHNRSGVFKGTDIKVENAGEVAFLNDFAQDGDKSGCGSIELTNFEIGTAGSFGIRNNGGTIALTNGTVGKTGNYALYVKDGDVTTDNVDFLGVLDETRNVVQIGLSSAPKGSLTMTETTITGGARGITNNGTLVINSGKIYGNRSAGETKTGAGITNRGVMTMYGGTICDNYALSSGGGIYNDGDCTIYDGVVIRDNYAAASGGGIATKQTLHVYGGTITGNTAANYGGGIYVNDGGNLTYCAGSVNNNYSGKGGGGISVSGSATIGGGTVNANKTGALGGGIYIGGKGVVTVCGVTVSNNTSGEEKNGGGIYNLGKLTISAGRIVNNTSNSYGGGVCNATTSDGTKHGDLVITGGVISGNKSVKGGGGVYTSGTAKIAGGTIINNETGTRGEGVYSSGKTTITGGKINGHESENTGTPYDLYVYKGTTTLSGAPDFLSVYVAANGHLAVGGTITGEPYNLYLTSYFTGDEALLGSTKLIKNNKDKFNLPERVTSAGKYIDNNGLIAIDPTMLEAELWRDGEKISEGLLKTMVSDSKNGDVIKLVSDAVVDSTIEFSSSKNITLTDDGSQHTILFANEDAAKCGFYIFGAKSTETPVTVVIEGTDEGGIVLKGSEAKSAGILVSDFGNLIVNGNVEITGFKNTETSEASSKTGRTSGKNGAAIFMFSDANNTVELNGTVITDCAAATTGAVLYQQKNCVSILNDITVSECAGESATNGSVIFATGTDSVVNVNNSMITGNDGVVNGSDINTVSGSYAMLSGVVKVDAISINKPVIITSPVETGSTIGIYTTNYVNGETIIIPSGDVTADDIAETVEKVTLLNNEGVAVPTYLLGDDGKLYKNEEAFAEAELIKNGERSAIGTLAEMIEAAENGDTVRLINDASITSCITIDKNVTITDDGTNRTIAFAVTDKAGLFVKGASTTKTATVVIKGTENGGLTLTGDGIDRKSCAVLIQSYGTVKASGNVVVKDFVNTAVSGGPSASGLTSQSYGAAFCTFDTQYAKLELDGTVIQNCKSAATGSAIYTRKNNKNITLKNVEIINCQNTGANGAAVFADGIVSITDTIFENNSGTAKTPDIYVVTSTGILNIGGNVVADISINNNSEDDAVTLNSALSDDAQIGIYTSKYVNGSVVINKSDSNVDDRTFENAIEKIDLLNNEGIEDPELTLGTDGKLHAAIAAVEAELYDSNGVRKAQGSFTELFGQATEGDKILLCSDAEYPGNIEMKNIIIDGGEDQHTLSVAGYINVSASVTNAKLVNLVFTEELESISKAFIYNQGTIDIANCVISNVVSTGDYGGAVYNYKGTLSMTDSIVTGCKSNKHGGGIAAGSSSVRTRLVDCTITGNSKGTQNGSYGNDVYAYNAPNIEVGGTTKIDECYLGGSGSTVSKLTLTSDLTGYIKIAVASSTTSGRAIIVKGTGITDQQLRAAVQKLSIKPTSLTIGNDGKIQ